MKYHHQHYQKLRCPLQFQLHLGFVEIPRMYVGTLPRVCAVGWVGHGNTINEPTSCGLWHPLDKMTTLYFKSEVKEDDITASNQPAQQRHPHMLTCTDCATGYDEKHFRLSTQFQGQNIWKVIKHFSPNRIRGFTESLTKEVKGKTEG
jgi:hypothetical protein